MCHPRDCIPSDSKLLVSERILALVNFKIQYQTIGLARTNTFIPVGFGFGGTNCRTGHRPVNGIICSSTQAFPSLGRLRQPYCTLFKKGLTFQRGSRFFSLSETSRSLVTLMDCLILKNLSRLIASAITGTLVFAAQYIRILGYPRHAMYIDMPKKVFSSSGVVFRLPLVINTFRLFVCSDISLKTWLTYCWK